MSINSLIRLLISELLSIIRMDLQGLAIDRRQLLSFSEALSINKKNHMCLLDKLSPTFVQFAVDVFGKFL